MKILYVLLSVAMLFFVNAICVAEEDVERYNDIIRNGSIEMLPDILNDLDERYESKGRDTIDEYITSVAERFIEILDSTTEDRETSEREAETMGKMLKLLSVSGDEHAKDALLMAMESDTLGGAFIKQGIMNQGPEIIPEVVELIDNSKNYLGQAKAIETLCYIYDRDTGKKYFNNKDVKEIQEKIIPFLTKDNETLQGSAIRGLGAFGDSTVIPLLEKVKDENKQNIFGEEYQENVKKRIREQADESIQKIKEK